MNRNELSARVARKCGVTRTVAEAVISAMEQEIADTLYGGEEIRLHGFGSFELREMEERTSRNPRTGETIRAKEKRKAVFRFSKTINDRISGGKNGK